jgi:hypothetical protein
MVSVIDKVYWFLVVSLSRIDRLAPLLNLDPFIYSEVTRATNLRVFRSPLGHWIHAEVTSTKSHSGRMKMI